MWDGSGFKQPRAEKKPAPKSRRRTPLKPGKPLAQESEKQSVLNKRWNFIRHCFLQCQKKTDGFYSCMNCGAKYDNAKQVQLNHIVRRSRGGEYTPQNAELLGAGPGTCQCHEKADGNLVRWTKGEAS